MGGRNYNHGMGAGFRSDPREMVARSVIRERCTRGDHFRTTTVPAGIVVAVGGNGNARVLTEGTTYCPFCGAEVPGDAPEA